MAGGLRKDAALAFGLLSERVATVLDEGNLDLASRERLADIPIAPCPAWRPS